MNKTPSPQDAEKCLDLRKRSKRGEHLTIEDSQFISFMFKKYSSWYKKTEIIVFNETIPFGSNIQMKKEGELK